MPVVTGFSLDIDGVLHRAENGSTGVYACAGSRADAMPADGNYPFHKLAYRRTREMVLSHFPAGIRDRIAGLNPDLDGLVNNHVRYHECMAVVKRFGLQHYTFVDDTARLFPTDCPALFLTHRHEGLNATQGSALIDRIRLMK